MRCVSSERRRSVACRWSRKGARSSESCPWATLPSRAIQSRPWATSARHPPIRKSAAPRVRFVRVRHEEAASFMACAYATFTSELGVSLTTLGAGGIPFPSVLHLAGSSGRVHLAFPVDPDEKIKCEGVVSQPIDDVVRQRVSELLREGAPGRFLCIPCLVRLLQDVRGIPYARRQIDRSLATIVRSPGSLTHLRSFTCDRCGRTAPCLGAKPASPRGDSGV